MGKRVRKAVGTYGMSDMLRNPARQIRISSEGPPGREAGSVDIAAVRAGEARRVSCFLRGTLDPFPRRLKQGDLDQTAVRPRQRVSPQPQHPSCLKGSRYL